MELNAQATRASRFRCGSVKVPHRRHYFPSQVLRDGGPRQADSWERDSQPFSCECLAQLLRLKILFPWKNGSGN